MEPSILKLRTVPSVKTISALASPTSRMRMETKPDPATLCSPLKMRQWTSCTNLVILSTIYHPQNLLKHSKSCEILSYKHSTTNKWAHSSVPLKERLRRPRGEYRYSSTLSLTSALDGGWVTNATPQPLNRWERPGTHCIGSWVGSRASLDECGKSCPHWDSIPGPSSP